MELIFGILCFSLIAILIAENFRLLKKFLKSQENIEKINETIFIVLKNQDKKINTLYEKLEELQTDIKNLNRSMLDFRAYHETAKPIKPNNWDSVREAFKGPVRINIHERD